MNDRDHEIIRAAAFVECAGVLETRATEITSGRLLAKRIALNEAANDLRDRAFKIRQAAGCRPEVEFDEHVEHTLPQST